MTYKAGFYGVVAVVLALGVATAQEKQEELGWKKSVVGNLNISQANFDNWTQGGENTLAWQLGFNALFENNQERFNWKNQAKFAFGHSKVGDTESRKSVDEIKLESVYTRKLGIFVNPYAAFAAETQFARGYQYSDAGKQAVSNFLDPGYFTESIGLGVEPTPGLKSRFGFAVKSTVTRDFNSPYADDPTTSEIEKIRTEAGMETVTDISRKLAENILYTGKLGLFSNLKGVREVDIRWDNLFSAKISRFLNVTFMFNLFYDRDISRKRQLQQSLALGFGYTFM